MTADEVRARVHRHRPAAIAGGLIGLAVLIAYVVYEFAMTPKPPDLQKSPPAEIVAYIANPRGLDKQPQVEQQRFLERWRDLLLQDTKKKDELTACFETLDDELRQAFSAEIFKHFKRNFLDDAKAYTKLAQEERYAFLQDRATEYRNRAMFLKDVAKGFGKQFKGTEDDLRAWIMEHTTAEERAIGEPYVEALKKIEEQAHKERHRSVSAPAAADASSTSAKAASN
ncbi:MAG TPA: hypothetical protein VMV94_02175 [Phycisphaerae bacterium]|nr:hypothetical protein [Phycisphaerae bacterium]